MTEEEIVQEALSISVEDLVAATFVRLSEDEKGRLYECVMLSPEAPLPDRLRGPCEAIAGGEGRLHPMVSEAVRALGEAYGLELPPGRIDTIDATAAELRTALDAWENIRDDADATCLELEEAFEAAETREDETSGEMGE